MMTPLISIITISFNSEKTIQNTINSVATQTYRNFEYIIVDGKSTDGTVDIIKKNNSLITRWVSEPDRGISDAFNKGIMMATGEIIGLINSDDQLFPNALEIVAKMYSTNYDVYCGNQELWNPKTDRRVIYKPSIHFSFKGTNNICHPATFVTKSAYEKYGLYDANCKYAMDCDLLMRFERAGAKFLHIDQTLACFSMGGITFSKIDRNRIAEIESIYRKNGATNFDILRYKLIRFLKSLFIKIVGRDLAARINSKLR